MTIKDLGGEFALINRIAATVGSADLGTVSIIAGIGDDAAVLRPPADIDLVVTTDLLIEDVHFRRAYGDPFSLGAKAAAVNLSDIAAMGGTPTAAFISLALPSDIPLAYLDELYRGMNEMFARFGAVIAGGDTNMSPGKITINVTLMGAVPKEQAVLRSTAKPGDILVVTGGLGAAAAGFALLEQIGRDEAEQISPDAVTAQLRPVPRIPAARAAAAAYGGGGVTSMMDLSDGLMGDLAKLCRASGVGAVVRTDRVPVAEAAVRVAERLNATPLDWALSGGEDYELLLTVAASAVDAVCAAIEATGLSARVVGAIEDGDRVRLIDGEGRPIPPRAGWDHFSP